MGKQANVPIGKLRRDVPMTCPPRMEAKVKEAMMQPVRKPKVLRQEPRRPRKAQGLTEKQRKNYQLPTPKGRR